MILQSWVALLCLVTFAAGNVMPFHGGGSGYGLHHGVHHILFGHTGEHSGTDVHGGTATELSGHQPEPEPEAEKQHGILPPSHAKVEVVHDVLPSSSYKKHDVSSTSYGGVQVKQVSSPPVYDKRTEKHTLPQPSSQSYNSVPTKPKTPPSSYGNVPLKQNVLARSYSMIPVKQKLSPPTYIKVPINQKVSSPYSKILPKQKVSPPLYRKVALKPTLLTPPYRKVPLKKKIPPPSYAKLPLKKNMSPQVYNKDPLSQKLSRPPYSKVNNKHALPTVYRKGTPTKPVIKANPVKIMKPIKTLGVKHISTTGYKNLKFPTPYHGYFPTSSQFSYTAGYRQTYTQMGKAPPMPTGTGCPYGWISYNGHCYYFSRDKISWFQASMKCRFMGGYLAVVDAPHENSYIKLIAKKYALDDSCWIGLNDILFDKIFIWEGGNKQCRYWDWFKNKPDYTGTGYRHCAALSNTCGFQWRVDNCNKKSFYICELNPGKPCKCSY